MLFSVLFWSLFARGITASASAPAPFSVQASEYWDGDDGPWSTFQFQIGSPPQQVRLLPSNSGDTIAPILSVVCESAPDQTTCEQQRGLTFNPNASTTWSGIGNYSYTGSFTEAALLGDIAAGEFGTDDITLSWPGGPSPTITNGIVSAMMNDTLSFFCLGLFGLSPRAANITSITDSYPSTLGWLNASNQIPSASWAYTAGSHGESPPAYGSLTLGGYDTTRFLQNNVTFPFGTDITLDLTLAIQQISLDPSTSLLSDPVYAYIDSEIPFIYLPMESCQAFQKAFNLTYSQGAYLVSDSQHQTLLNLNPSVTFTLGPSLAGGSSVDITLPYAAFDLTFTPPIGSSEGVRYFPIQIAQNSTQYTLGRTFLQYAYVIADYDRSTFSVSRALFPQNTQPQIQAIYRPSQDMNALHLSTGVIAGIVVGAVALLLLLVLTAFLVRRRILATRVAKAAKAEQSSLSGLSAYEKAELGNNPPRWSRVHGNELPGEGLYKPMAELDMTQKAAEMNSVRDAVELDMTRAPRRGRYPQIYELEAN